VSVILLREEARIPACLENPDHHVERAPGVASVGCVDARGSSTRTMRITVRRDPRR